jgi:manganese/zinc/iron transport system permease protein
LPTGPTVVLVATFITAVSLLFAPRRGVVWGAIRRWRHRREVQLTAALRDVAEAAGGSAAASVSLAEIGAMRGSQDGLANQLATLASRGLIERAINGAGEWRLTDAGVAAAHDLARRERIWKRSMARQMELSVDAVHYDASEIERVLPPETLAAIEAELSAEDAANGWDSDSGNGPRPVAAGARSEHAR